MVLSARLTEEITIKVVAVSASTVGEPIETFTDYETIYASIINQKGTGNFNSSLPGNTYTDNISFYCRFMELPESKKKYRIQYNNELYKIINLTPIQRNSALVIDCELVK